MDTKPFDLGATERVVKFFGGDKQKMLQAYQSGALRQFAPAPMDQTLLIAAGMLADRMRSAAQQEAAPQQTVAQQTFTPQPPMGAPPAPPAGLGATPQAAAMPPMNAMPPMDAAPQMGMPQMEMPAEEMPMMAEGGMVPPYASGGGLSDVPVPDGMFDEPSNGGFGDGYAGGGMVAFAAGGRTGYNDFRRAIIEQESGGRYGIANAEGSGAMGIGQLMPDTARAIAKRIGLPYRPELLAGKDEASRKYQDTLTSEAVKEAFEYGKGDPQLAAQYYFAGPNKAGHGPKTQKYGMDIMRRLGKEGTPMPREADTSTAGGRAMSLEDQLGFADRLFNNLPREELERAKAETLKDLDAANIKKQERLGEAAAMMNAGFVLMGQSGPLSTSIANAGAAYMASLQGSRKEQKAAKNEAIRNLMAYEELDRKTATAALEFGMDAYKVGLTAEQQQRALDFQKVELMSRIEQAGLDRASAEKIASMRTSSPTQFESIMNIIQNGSMEEKAALEQYMKVTKPQPSMAGPGMEEMGGAEGPQPVILGSRPA